jgi:D-apionolactonase
MAKFGGGTNLYFTEINRERPPLDALKLFCYSINPQVHAVDDLSLIENLAAQAETVRSARHFAGALPIALTPDMPKPRFNPHNGLHGFAQADVSDTLPASVDARQPTLFAAA